MSEPSNTPPENPQFLPPEQLAPPQAPPAAEPNPYPAAGGDAYGLPAGEAGEPATPIPAARENVGRGILFSLLAVVLGALLAGGLYQMGYIASITSFIMAVAAGWLYVKGAGAAPRAGLWPLVGVIVVGVIISLFTMLGWGLYSEIAAAYPDAASGDIMSLVFQLMFEGEVWGSFAKDAGIFVLFAALGTFATLRQLGRANKAAQA
jgi:hypothetical protein